MPPEQLKLVWLDPKKLKDYDNNAKVHTQEQIEELAAQIVAHGFDQPIAVEKDLTIIKGHGRKLGAIHAKLKTVPVIIRADLTREQAMAARLADNAIPAMTGFDYKKLKVDIAALSKVNFNLKLTGLKPVDINLALNGWKSNIEMVQKTKANTDGILVVIKVVCPQAHFDRVRAALSEAIESLGVDGVTLE